MSVPSQHRIGFAAAVRTAIAGFASLVSVAVVPAAAEPKIGAPAPAFEALDTDGKPVSLAGLKGKTVVLEWTNHGCPFVAKHYRSGNMQALQREAAAEGIVWLSIVSSAPGQQGHISDLEAATLTAERKAAPSAVLLDPKGTIGRAYNARTTPQMFVIAADGMLRYMGGIDDKPSTNDADVKTARNYVREALAALKAGTPIAAASTRPYGCSVKYAPAS